MNERRRFIEDWLQHNWTFLDLCRHYEIAPKTGYKWVHRFEEGGYPALADQRRAPKSHPNITPPEVEGMIVAMRHKYPRWGPLKLETRLERVHPDQVWPAPSTIGEILKRKDLVAPRIVRRRTPLFNGPYCAGLNPNEVWAGDFKGTIRTLDGDSRDPFTLSDLASRYLLKSEPDSSKDEEAVRSHLTVAFEEYGLPTRFLSDNGPPFATVGAGGLSRLSVWLIRLGIIPARIRPGHPEENGVHERMHGTLKLEVTAQPNAKELKKELERFRYIFNHERPHEALGMLTPNDLYYESPRRFPAKLPDMAYPPGVEVRRVNDKGVVKWRGIQFYISIALAGEEIGLTEQTDDRWSLRFGPIELGHIDLKTRRFEKLDSVRVLPMCPV